MLIYASALAQPIVLTPQTESINVCPSTSVFADTTGQLSFNQIREKVFEPYRGQEFQFGFSSSVFWFRFTIEPGKQPSLSQWYLLWSDGLRDRVDIYVPQPNGTWKVMEGGMLAPPERKAYHGLFPIYPLGTFQSAPPQTFYLRLEASEAINGQLTLLTSQAYIDAMPTTLAMVWLVIGIQLLRVFYNIILARYIRDTSFRWYVFHTVIVTASVLGSFGVIGTLLGQYPHLASFFNTAFFELMPASYTLFIYSLLSVRRNFPAFRWVFFTIVGLSVLQLVLYPFVPRMYLLIANNYLFLFMEAFLIGISSYALIRRIAMNSYLLIPCFITLVPFIFLNLRALGVIQYSWIYPMIYATNFLEIVALALVLGKIIQSAEQQRLASEKAFFAEKIEAEKLAELDSLKTRFFTNISHEFRTPLTLLLGPISDLLKRFPADELYQIMYRNANRLQTLINQLLDLSKLDGGQLRPDFQNGDLAVDIRTWVASFESLATSRQITLTIQQNYPSYPAIYDFDKTEKITTNLISNALKFTPTGGQVWVEAVYTDSRVTLAVTDTGAGIAPEHLPYIFDRFYQVDASQRRGYEGTGVGLALVRELVRLLDGQITVDSQPEKGTVMTVILPLTPLPANQPLRPARYTSDQEAGAEANQPSQQPQPITDPVMKAGSTIEKAAHSQSTVLVVEDNDDLRTYVRATLSPYYQVVEAVDGQQGLEIALQIMPDLIVTDLMMPRLDGLELCRALRADDRTSHIPVVMLTAKAAIENRLEGLEVGADDYLTKPFVPLELIVRLQNLARRQQLLRQYFSRTRLYEADSLSTDSRATLIETPLNELQRAFMAKLYAYIEQYLSTPALDVEQVAAHMAMTSRNLNRKLNALAGMTTGELIRSFRLSRAAELLKTGMSPTETAYEVGFESPSAFSRAFRERYEQSPSQFTDGSRPELPT